MNRDPRHIDMAHPMNDAGTHYITGSGNIEPSTVDYVLDLLNKTVDNPNHTVSKQKLKHIAAQLLARNALVERNNDLLTARVAELQVELTKLQALADTVSLAIEPEQLTLTSMQKLFHAQELEEQYLAMSARGL